MSNSKHIVKQKFPPLSNLHIIWNWTKRIVIVGILAALVANYGTVATLAIIAGFFIFRSLIWLAFRVLVMLALVILLVMILGLIIL